MAIADREGVESGSLGPVLDTRFRRNVSRPSAISRPVRNQKIVQARLTLLFAAGTLSASELSVKRGRVIAYNAANSQPYQRLNTDE